MSESVWERDLLIPERNKLEETLKTDVCIIGAGLAGILTGYMLWEAGLDTVILEADRIGSGQTRGTTAKITSQHGLIYSKLLKRSTSIAIFCDVLLIFIQQNLLKYWRPRPKLPVWVVFPPN